MPRHLSDTLIVEELAEDKEFVVRELNGVLTYAKELSQKAIQGLKDSSGDSYEFAGFLFGNDESAHLVFGQRPKWSEQGGSYYESLVTTAVVASKDGCSTRVFPVTQQQNALREVALSVQWHNWKDRYPPYVNAFETLYVQSCLIPQESQPFNISLLFTGILQKGITITACCISCYLLKYLGLKPSSAVNRMYYLASKLEQTYGRPGNTILLNVEA